MYAEQVNYWQTSRTAAATWTIKTLRLITALGGEVQRHAFASEQGRSAFMVEFTIEGQPYRMVWPVLAPKGGNLNAAEIQAATAMYHAVKNAVVNAKFIGARAAFFPFLQVGNGQVAADLTGPE